MSKPRALWRGFPFPAKSLVVSATGCLALLMAAQLPWIETAQNYFERRAERGRLAPILAEAGRLNVTFPQVVVAHPAYVGKLVYWDVTVVSPSSSYAEGRPAWSITWTNPERVETGIMSYQHERVLARVVAVREDVVYLEYLGRP